MLTTTTQNEETHDMQDTNHLIKMSSITDEMAVIRTRLANERTFLAYSRTFIGSFAAGVGFIKFTGDLLFVRIGFVMVAISPFILAFGLLRFIQVKRGIALSAFKKIASGRRSKTSGDTLDESR